MYQETFLQRYISAWDFWPEPLGALTFVIYFCICRPAIQAFQRMNHSTLESPTLDTRNNGLSVIGTKSHSNSTTRIVCIRKCSCIRNNGLSVIGSESHSNSTTRIVCISKCSCIRNNGLSVIGTESHSNSTTRIVCIRKCTCIRNHGLSVIGTESHSKSTTRIVYIR